MVIGLGTDLTEVARIRRSIERFGSRFLERVFTPGEIAYCETRAGFAESFAARFAAKEAAAKALGTGMARGVNWREFEVTRERGHAPQMLLAGRARQLADGLRVSRITLSLTHTRDTALAVVIMESNGESPD